MPLSVVLSILQLLPQEAFIARLVNKACREVFSKHCCIHANYADLPLWVLREFYSSLRSDFERKQLVTARAGLGKQKHVNDACGHVRLCQDSAPPAAAALLHFVR